MDVKLLASDMDGTLLQNGAKRPTDEAFELIQQLKEQGILFAAASGRQYHSLRELFAPIADDIAYICENGCLAVYQDEVLYQAKITKKLARDIVDTVESNPRFMALPGGVNAAYLLRGEGREEMADLLINYFNYNIKWIDDFFDIPEDIIKVAVYCPDGVTKNDVEFLEKKFKDVASVATSGAVWIDLMPKNITKKIGLEKLASHFDISVADCMAVGDEYNDYEMLSTVGHPVAMDNARTGIREICPQQTDTVENLMRTLL